MLQKKDRSRAVGVLVSHDEGKPEATRVTAEVVWGLVPFTAPRVSAATEAQAIELLHQALCDRYRSYRESERTLAVFYSVEASQDSNRKSGLATMMLSGALGPGTRQNIADALGIDRADNPGQQTEDSHELLQAFDRITAALAQVESGHGFAGAGGQEDK